METKVVAGPLKLIIIVLSFKIVLAVNVLDLPFQIVAFQLLVDL
jgi:hypothetical protein